MLNKKISLLIVLIISSTLVFSQSEIDNNIITSNFANGQLKTLNVMTDTIKNGIQLSLDKYGRLEKQEQYLFGVLDGKQLDFERGRVTMIKTYSNGLLEGNIERFTTSRKLSSSESYIKGVKSGESKWFYYSGKLCATYNYENGIIVGESKFYFENGKVKSIYNFKDNKIDGVYTEFDENEKKILVGQYSKGKKEGKWKHYDEKGKLIKTEKYKKGVKK